jgi:hypothetical protein
MTTPLKVLLRRGKEDQHRHGHDGRRRYEQMLPRLDHALGGELGNSAAPQLR